jgi:tetratricopeptide (TPR) repeat protein
MEHAYRHGLKCHRDIKPANIMITADGYAKITDFGLAHVFDGVETRGAMNPEIPADKTSLSFGGKSCGTPTHMSPEQFDHAGTCDERSDIYSAGVVLFQLASGGRLPFFYSRAVDSAGNTRDIWQEFSLLHSLQAVPQLDSVLMPVINRCMAKNPAGRYTSFSQLRNDLEKLLKKLTGKTIKMPDSGQNEALDSLRLAYSYNRLGKYHEALGLYDKALKKMPGYGQPWRGKGSALVHLGRFIESLECFDKALHIDPRDSVAWTCKGGALSYLGRHEEAIACLDKAIAIGPPGADTLCNKANALSSLGRYHEALQSLEQCLSLDTGHAAAWCEKGRNLHALGRLQEAMPCYDRALQIDPYLPVAWYNKGLILDTENRADQAVACFRKFVELAPPEYYGAQIAHARTRLG